MKVLTGLITALSIPLIILNLFGGIASGVWLAFLGDWAPIVVGILAIIFSTWVLSFILMPSILLMAPAALCAEKGKVFGFLFFGALGNLYAISVITIWCCGVFIFFAKDATTSNLIPRLIWSYGVAMAPWMYMAQKEQHAGGGGLGSEVPTFFAQLAFVVAVITMFFVELSMLQWIKVFVSIMLIGFAIQMTLAIFIQKEMSEA